MSTNQTRTYALAGALALGCGNVITEFPPGLEPWEENAAALPSPVGDDVCPETTEAMVWVDQRYMGHLSTHMRACIHQPIDRVFAAALDPQTGRDGRYAGFSVFAYDTEAPEYRWSYTTHVDTGTFGVMFDLGWRHGIIEQDADGNLRMTATRWQKIAGSSAIGVMEGSLVLTPHPDEPSITLASYQYHLNASFSDHGTIHGYLEQIFTRLRDRAHGRELSPNNCDGCPEPPPHYIR